MTSRRLAAFVALAAAVLMGCGSDGTGPAAIASGRPPTAAATVTTTAEPVLPVTLTDATGSEVTVESIERIVPVDGDLAEIVFARGLEGFLAIPGIAETPAGEAGRVLAYEDQYLLGLGPRFGRMVTELTADLHPDLAAPPSPISTP